MNQLTENIASLTIQFTAEQLRMLNEASALLPVFPYPIFEPIINRGIFGGHAVQGWQ